MATSKFDNTWNLLSVYNFEAVEENCDNSEIICKICGNTMVDPHTTLCGCHFCYTCIFEYIGDEEKHCPGTGEECKEEYLKFEKNIQRDVLLRRKIVNLKVKCVNDSCPFITEISKMENHLKICPQRLRICPYGKVGCINERMEFMEDHLNFKVLKHSTLLVEAVHQLNNEINKLKDKVEQNENEIKKLKKEKEINKKEINGLKELDGKKEVLMKQIRGEVNKINRISTESKRNINENKIDLDSTKKTLINMKKENDQMRNNIQKDFNEINEVKKNNEKLKQENEEIYNSINEIKDVTNIIKSNFIKQYTEINRTNTTLCESRRNINENKKEIDSTKKAFIELEKEMDRIRNHSEKDFNDIEEVKNNIEKLTQKIKINQFGNEEIERSNDKLRQEKVEINNSINKMKDKITFHTGLIKEFREELNGIDITVNESKRNLSENRKDIASSNEELIKIQKELNKMRNLIKISYKETEELKNGNAIERINNSIDEMKDVIKIFERKEINQEMKYKNYEIKLTDIKNNVEKYTEEIVQIEMKIKERILNSREDFVWQVRDFARKIKNNGFYNSDTFYKSGYSCFLRIKVDGKHLYFSLVIMKGTSEENSLWPMKHTITFSINHPETLRNHKSWSSIHGNNMLEILFNNIGTKNKSEVISCGVISVDEIEQLVWEDTILVCCSLSQRN